MKYSIKEINWKHLFQNSTIIISSLYLSFFLLITSILPNEILENSVKFQDSQAFLYCGFFLSISVLAISLSYSISLIRFLQLTVGYILYLIASYFIVATKNLNNKNFDIWDINKNHFWEINSLMPVALIIVLALFFRYYIEKNRRLYKKLSFFNANYSYYVPLSLIMGTVILFDSKILSEFKSQLEGILASSGALTYLLALFRLLLIWYGLFTLISYMFFKAASKLRKNQPSFSLAVISSIFFAFIFNYALQFGVRGETDFFNKYIFPRATMFQIVVLTGIFIFCYLLINRYLSTTLLIITTGLILSVVNFLKFSMRSEPLLITDFAWIKDIRLVLSFVDSLMIIYIVIVVLVPILIYVYLRKRLLVGPLITKKRIRGLSLAFVVSLFTIVFFTFKNEEDGEIRDDIPIISELNNWLDITYMGHLTNARYKSVLYVWVKQLTKPVMETPKEYSRDKIEEIVEKYSKRADNINQSRNNLIENQTVIYILSESLSNPNRIKGITLSQNILENIDAIKNETTSGLMRSDGYGGGTANMEIQSLMGLPLYNLTTAVSVMTTEIVPKMKYIPSISDTFEKDNKIAIHLGDAYTYSRNVVYDNLKFGKFIAAQNSSSKPVVNEKKGLYPSDESTYENILSNLTNDSSQFFSVVTYQNHVPWSYGEPTDLSGTGEGFTEEENSQLSNYSRLIYNTDIATKEFLEKLKTFEKPITVVFYGDHLPGFYPQSIFVDDPNSQYQTDYFVWSNHNGNKVNYNLINSSDFPAVLLSHTNSKVSPYNALLTDVLENASIDKEVLTDEQQSIADDLKLIQYDLTSGRGYVRYFEKFFQVKK